MTRLAEKQIYRKNTGELLSITEIILATEQVIFRYDSGVSDILSPMKFTELVYEGEFTRISNDPVEIKKSGPFQIHLNPSQTVMLKTKKWATDAIKKLKVEAFVWNTILQKLQALAEKKCVKLPGKRTLQRWMTDSMSENQEIMMAPKPKGWRKGRTRVTGHVLTAFKNTLENIEKLGELQNITTLRQLTNRQLRHICEEAGTPIERVGRKKIESLLEKELAWNKKMKMWLTSSAYRTITRVAKKLHQSDRLLEVLEVDALIPDLHVCDEDGVIYGSPTIYAFIDVCTGMVTGIKAYMQSPGTDALIDASAHAFFPKEKRNGHEMPWGVPETVMSDQGSEFLSDFWVNLLLKLGAVGVYAEGEAGWRKPHIERFFKEIQERLLWRIPGTTRSELLKKNDSSLPKRTGTLTLRELQAKLDEFTFDVYPDIESDALSLKFGEAGMTPRKAWARMAKAHPPVIPISKAEFLDTTYMYLGKAKLSKACLTHDNLDYSSNELHSLQNEIGDQWVAVFGSPMDVSKIHVKHIASQKVATAFAKNDRLKGLSRAVWKAIMKDLGIGKKKVSAAEIDDSLADIINGALELGKKRKIGDRKRAVRPVTSLIQAQTLNLLIAEDKTYQASVIDEQVADEVETDIGSGSERPAPIVSPIKSSTTTIRRKPFEQEK